MTDHEHSRCYYYSTRDFSYCFCGCDVVITGIIMIIAINDDVNIIRNMSMLVTVVVIITKFCYDYDW